MMELSSVSPLQRSRLSTLRWRHPERAGADSTTEPPRRIKHRETTWEAPGSTTHRPLVRRGSVRYGAGSTATTAPTSTSTSTGPTPTRSLDEDMRVPETASAWTLASMKGLAPMPMKDETSAAQEKPPSAVLPEGMTFTSALPPIVIEVSTLPDVTPAHAHAVQTVVASAAAPGLELVLNKEPRPAAPGASLDKKAAAASSMMLDAEPHLPLESVFSTGRPAVQSRPVVPAAPAQPLPALSAAANNTGENLVVQPRPEEVIVEVEPAREKPPRKPSATTPPGPAHIAHNAVHAAEEEDEDEDEGATTNAPNIHVVDPPDLATPPVGPAPAAPATTSTTSTTSTSRRPDLWRPVQPEVQPAQPGPTAGPGPAMVEYFTFAPVASSPSASGSGTAVGSAPDTAPDTAPGTASAPSAPSAPSASPSQGPEQDEDVGPSSPAPTPFLGEEISVSTMSPEEAEEDARDQDEVLPGVFPVPFGTSTSPRPSVTTATSPTLDLDDDLLDSTTRQPAVPTPPTSTRQTEEPPSSEPTVGGVSTDNTTSSPSTVESTPVTAAPPIPTTRTAPPPPTSPPTAPATAPTVTTMPDLSSSAGPTEAAITTTTSIPMAPLSPGTSAPTTGAPTTTPSAITSTTPTPTPTPTPDVDVPAEETVPTIEDDGETPLPEEAAPEPAAPEPEPEPVPVPEAVPAYLRLLMETDWAQFCQEVEAFRQAAAALMSNGTSTIVKPSQVVLLNVGPTHCSEAADEARAEETTTTEMPSASTNPIANMISIQMYIADAGLHFSRNLTEDFLRFWGCRGLEYPIRKVDLVLPLGGADGGSSGQGSGAGVIAAIAISCVAAACLLVLAALLLIMRKRQKSLRYAQRCTPVSLDAYSLDSVSVCNSSSVRRKGAGAGGRASKRSYGNPAFTDPAAPSHPLTFPALSNMSGDRGSVEAEFSAIPQVAPKADELPDGADTRNRYANVIPLPETRVTLSCKDGDPLSQYINANYVRGPKNADKFYIACQAPLASTVHDFWRMVWETQAKVILMLTDLVEDGVEKCADYLPPSEVTDCHRLFGDFQVTLKKREVKDKYVVSSIQLKNMETNLWREATHMWYMGWPSRGVPDDPSNIIAFLIEARAFMRNPSASSTGAGAGTGARGAPGARQAPRTPPHIVHCSPGTGRTGTVLAIDLCIRDFETTRQVDIPRTVYRLRKDRAGCVQTKEQYMFIYKALNLYATKLTGVH